jgi:hypothetical protein
VTTQSGDHSARAPETWTSPAISPPASISTVP